MDDQKSFPFMDEHKPRRRRRSRSEQPSRAVAKRDDPDTSWEAAASFSPEDLSRMQAMVLAYFRRVRRSSDPELRKAFGEGSDHSDRRFAYSTLQTRRCELVRRGLIRNSGEKTLNTRGKLVIVWELVD